MYSRVHRAERGLIEPGPLVLGGHCLRPPFEATCWPQKKCRVTIVVESPKRRDSRRRTKLVVFSCTWKGEYGPQHNITQAFSWEVVHADILDSTQLSLRKASRSI